VSAWLPRPLPWVLLGLTVAAEAAAGALSAGLEPAYDTWMYVVFSIVMATTGAIVAARRPENPIGWLFCVFAAINAFGDAVQGWGLRAADQGWPAGPAADWIATWIWLPSGFGLLLTFLLFPDGRLLSPRWRPVVWIGLAGTLLAIAGWSLSPDRAQDFGAGRNPLAVEWLPDDAVLAVGMTALLGALGVSAASLVVRFRGSRGVERQQLKWFALAAGVAAVVLPLTFVLWYRWRAVGVFAALSLTALPVAAGIAILRYRLYDIDLVLNRTLVYGSLTVLLAAAYAATTLVLGTALDSGSAWVTAISTLVAAVAFLPLRARLQAAVDRRFRRDRFDALRRMAAFLEELRAGRAAPEEIEGVLRDVLHDPRLELRFLIPETGGHADASGVERPDGEGLRRIPIERAGRPLGLVLYDPAVHETAELLSEVVAAGGLAIEIARLQLALRRQLAEVQESRARIVAAGHEERRRIERDLHDGAQQRLVSIGLALRHAQYELGSAPHEHVDATLEDAVGQISTAIEELRGLAQGLPPSQLDAGLAAALNELAARAPLPVRVQAVGDRFAPAVEATAYFIACEGLTNVVKHARAESVVLSAARDDGRLVVRVSDDGVGGAAADGGSGLTGLADRVLAAGGTFRVDSHPGAGTTLIAELPCGS
jgi:signal transduction histidine kinase